MRLAMLLLATGAARHYGWALFPEDIRGIASKALGAAAALVLLYVISQLKKCRWCLPVFFWWGYEELSTLLCSTAYAIHPWSVSRGESICSAWAGFDVGAFGIMALGCLAWRLSGPINNEQATQ